MKKNDANNGFTLIEVVLVLATAGLIFMMVFIALPALNRSQRDTQRKEDMMTLISAIQKYQTNNRGSLPSNSTGWESLVDDYVSGDFVDPASGIGYELDVAACNATAASSDCSNQTTGTENTIYIRTQATCDGEKAIKSNNPRNVAVLYELEGGGIYCGNT